MAFSGPLPERVNGRMAMIGFLAAVGAELSTGESLTTQWANHPFTVPFHMALFALASAIPAVVSGTPLSELLEAAQADKMSDRLKYFTADVELLNGRVAMLGITCLIAVETWKQSALF